MATAFEKPVPASNEEKFFFRMACVMAAVIVAGFATNLALGRSTFAVPLVYHIHAFVFFGGVVIFVAQNYRVAHDNLALHRKPGWIAVVWVPVMVALAVAIMFTSLRRNGGPFFFDQNEFMISNVLQLVCFAGLVGAAIQLVCFAGLVGAAIRQRRNTGWHRRLMFVAMAILTGPGLGRLLPMPLMIPHAWRIMVVVTMIFPIIMMIADKRRYGKVHPALLWGVGVVLVTQVVADLIAYSPLGESLTHMVIDGTPGAERPMAAFLPPGVL